MVLEIQKVSAYVGEFAIITKKKKKKKEKDLYYVHITCLINVL